MGKGLATLTFDDKFQQKRREMIKKRGNQDNLAVGMARNTRYDNRPPVEPLVNPLNSSRQMALNTG